MGVKTHLGVNFKFDMGLGDEEFLNTKKALRQLNITRRAAQNAQDDMLSPLIIVAVHTSTIKTQNRNEKLCYQFGVIFRRGIRQVCY